MAKIIHFSQPNDVSLKEYIQETKQILEEEGVDNLLIAAKLKDGRVITGYYHCDFGSRQELLGHIQCDVIDQMIQANYD